MQLLEPFYDKIEENVPTFIEDWVIYDPNTHTHTHTDTHTLLTEVIFEFATLSGSLCLYNISHEV